MYLRSVCQLALLVVGLGGFTTCDSGMEAEEQNIQELQEMLPVGSTRQEVETLLRSHQIEFSFVDREQLDLMMLNRDRPPATSATKGRYLGVVRDVEKRVSRTKSYSIEIDIDSNDRVSGVRVIPILTAP